MLWISSSLVHLYQTRGKKITENRSFRTDNNLPLEQFQTSILLDCVAPRSDGDESSESDWVIMKSKFDCNHKFNIFIIHLSSYTHFILSFLPRAFLIQINQKLERITYIYTSSTRNEMKLDRGTRRKLESLAAYLQQMLLSICISAVQL